MSQIKENSITVSVGSANKMKVRAASEGLSKGLKLNISIVEGFNVPSGVPNQPIGDNETKQGSINRSKLAFESFNEKYGYFPNYSIGLEGGILINTNEIMECFAYMCIYDGSRLSTSRTGSFSLPPAICELVKGGMELGDADDKIFGTTANKQAGGTVGHLTNGVIDRQSYYEHAIILACVPFLFPDLYPI